MVWMMWTEFNFWNKMFYSDTQDRLYEVVLQYFTVVALCFSNTGEDI